MIGAAVHDITHPLPVFKHEDPVPGQAADHRLGSPRPHAAHGYARNSCNRLCDGRFEPPLQLLPCKDGGRPDRLVRSRGTQDRGDDKVRQGDGGYLEVDRDRLPLFDLDGSRRIPEAIDPEPMPLGIRHGDPE